MTWRSWSGLRSTAWVWRSCRRSARRRTSRVGSLCACWRIGARRSPASSFITPGNGSYRRHWRCSSKPCVCSCTDRVALLRRGVVLEGVTVGYNALEGILAIAAGLAAGSVALKGFGIDSVIEVTSGALWWWRLRAELGSALLGPTVERRSARRAGVRRVALGVYIVIDSA